MTDSYSSTLIGAEYISKQNSDVYCEEECARGSPWTAISNAGFEERRKAATIQRAPMDKAKS